MTQFKEGDTVRVIDAGDAEGYFEKGDILTISAIAYNSTVRFEGMNINWSAQRFELVDTELSTSAEGVWAVIDRDYSESITAVYATEIEALRVLSGRGYGRVQFLKYGETV